MSITPLPGGKDGPCRRQAKKGVVLLSRWLQALREAYFALNERGFRGSRRVEKIAKRAVGHSGVDPKSWIEPFHGNMQKPRMASDQTRIDEIVDGIYRISTWQEPYGITFNQFLIADERPALIHTGMHHLYEPIRRAIGEVLDPAKLTCVVLLHWEGDENGGMDRFMAQAPQSELVGSLLSIQLNAFGFGLTERVRGVRDGETLDLGKHKLRFIETPHVHHWDSMMVIEEATRSLFPADLFIQPADQPPVVTEDLSTPMIDLYRAGGVFAHEFPIRHVVDRLEKLDLAWIHPMHGGSFERSALPKYASALRDHEFAYHGMLLGREVAKVAPV